MKTNLPFWRGGRDVETVESTIDVRWSVREVPQAGEVLGEIGLIVSLHLALALAVVIALRELGISPE